jgi:hypothetical protein
MGVLIEVVKAPDQEHRYLTVPGNTYSGRTSCKFVNLARASTKFHGQWTGGTSMAIAERVYEDFLAAANSGQEAEYFKSIRVTTYHNDASRREVYLPRVVEQQQPEPEVLPVAQASDGSWREVPTTGFKKGMRAWTYSGAFVDSYGEPRAIQISGPTKRDVVLKLFGSQFPPFLVEFVKTFPLATPGDIPKAPEPETVYEPTAAEVASISPMTLAEWHSTPSETAKRRFLFDWKFKVAFDKMVVIEEAKKAEAAAKKQREDEKAKLDKMREEYRRKDAEEAAKASR